MAPAVNTTLSPPIPINSTSSTIWYTLSPMTTNSTNSTIWYTTPAPYVDYYWTFYPSYGLYVLLVFLFVFVLPLIVIMNAMHRKRQANARALALQRQRARRQMEINVSNNNCSGGSGGVAGVCVADNDFTILPKTLDLPPSYDEAAFYQNKEQQLNGASNAASTLTIATNLESSNPNLTTLNEPPPVYEPASATTTTTTTTLTTMMVVNVNGAMPVM